MIELTFNFSKSKYKNVVYQCVNKKVLSRFIRKYCGNIDVLISYNFVRSKEQIKMNSEFKKHFYNTDILTFNLSESDCELTGDVYISLKQVESNAKKYKVKLEEEMNRVIIHGFLHLIGLNDETKEEQKRMRKEENRYLKYVVKNVPRGT